MIKHKTMNRKALMIKYFELINFAIEEGQKLKIYGIKILLKIKKVIEK